MIILKKYIYDIQEGLQLFLEICIELYISQSLQSQMYQKIDVNGPQINGFKTKAAPFLPKIANVPGHSKIVLKQIPKRVQNQSIFKNKQQQSRNINIVQVNPQNIYNSKQYKQLYQQIQKMHEKFDQQMSQIDQRKQKINQKLKLEHRRSYQNKYMLWELRNQIIQLQNVLLEQQNQQARLLYELGYGQYQEQYQQQPQQSHVQPNNQQQSSHESKKQCSDRVQQEFQQEESRGLSQGQNDQQSFTQSDVLNQAFLQ